MRFLNTTLPTGPRCDADARVGARVFCSKGLYVCTMYDCMYYCVNSVVELEGAELIRGRYIFTCLSYLYTYIIHCCLSGLKTWWSCLWGQIYIFVRPKFLARTCLQPHYGNGVFGNVYLSAGQH